MSSAVNPIHRPLRRRGFTLTELVVVTCILLLLLALTTTGVQGARTAGSRVACIAKLRSIGVAMISYATQNNGYIPGSGNTSARHMWTKSRNSNNCIIRSPNVSINNIALVNEPLDWCGPIAREMGLTDPSLTSRDGKARFRFYTSTDVFLCPAYAGVMWRPDPSGSNEGVRQALSYATAQSFLLRPRGSNGPYGQDSGFQGNIDMPADPYWHLPNSYEPKIARVGMAQRKIFAADAARRTRNFSDKNNTPYYLLSASPSTVNSNESMFSDWGPFCGNTRSYDRSAIPGNAASTPETDIRRLSFRHGKTDDFLRSDQYALNAVFYDGHVETLDGNAAANPSLWLPAGTVITNPAARSQAPDGSAIIYADVAARYNITNNYLVK